MCCSLAAVPRALLLRRMKIEDQYSENRRGDRETERETETRRHKEIFALSASSRSTSRSSFSSPRDDDDDLNFPGNEPLMGPRETSNHHHHHRVVVALEKKRSTEWREKEKEG